MGEAMSQLGAGQTFPTWLLIVVAAVTVGWAIFRSIGRRKDPLEQKPFAMPLSQQRNVERQMEGLLVEMSEMARQITSQLETRAAKLDLLIKEADRKISELKALEAGKSGGAAAAVGEAALPSEEVDPRHAQIYVMADQGRGTDEIARQLDRPKGEIELILALRPK